MYELDHMLNGKGSRQHHENMIREAQHDKFASHFKPNSPKRSAVSFVRLVWVTIINIIMR